MAISIYEHVIVTEAINKVVVNVKMVYIQKGEHCHETCY